MNEKAIKSFLIVGLIGTIGLVFLLNFKEHVIYPVPDLSQYEIGTYHEEMDSNWTDPKFTIEQEKIHFSYRLTTAREEPFAAFYFRHASIDSNLLDVSHFDHLRIYLKSNEAQRIPITMRFRNDSIIKLSKEFPEISVRKVVEYQKEGVYLLDLKEFEIAAWWLRYHGIEKEHIDLSQTTLLKYLEIGSCQALEPGSSDTIVIDQVVFYNDNKWVYFSIIGLWCSILISLLILKKLKGRRKTIVVEHIEIVDEGESDKNLALLIKQFIGQHYTNPDLSMYHIQKELKISANEVRRIFKQEINDSFKNYLKTVRIVEVKRLLLESNLSVSEIAYKCGFNDIPHFNRLFKAEVGTTPKEFRKA